MDLPRDVVEIPSGLWRWTVPHPAWEPDAEPDSPADWDRDVGCVACLLPEAAVFIDALIPEERDDLWRWAEGLAAARDTVLALTTIHFHSRSREALASRLGAETAVAPDSLPAGVEAIPLPQAREVVYWLAEQRTVVPGDRIMGAPGGGLRLCPESWLRYLGNGLGHAGLRELLQPLRALPAERVLVSHGEPVLERGDEALAKLLG